MLRVFEAFSGYGSQSIALKRLGVEFEVVAISEIDKYAIKAYEAIHGLVKNVGDISKVRLSQIPDHDLFTYSFPCQDISIAGKQGSLEKGSETRSSLLWECERIIRFKRPKYLLLENVKNLVGKKHKEHFDEWLKVLEGYGYKNYWQVLNAKDYGIPQNRERVFVVSILGDDDYEFPKKQELKLRLKDVLEIEVDEKYYLSEELHRRFVYKKNDNQVKMVGNTNPSGRGMNGSVFEIDGLSPTLTTNKGEGIRVVGTIENWVKYTQLKQVLSTEGICTTLDTMQGGHRQPKIWSDFRIRKLSPLECWSLMDVSKEDFQKVKDAGISDSQLYKLAGNSIVVNVLTEIFKNLLKVPVGVQYAATNTRIN